MLNLIIVGLTLFGTQAGRSPFNSYVVFLGPTQIPGGCSIADPDAFRNRTYAFRGRMHRDMPLVLRDGKAVERDDVGRADWETTLVRQRTVTVGDQSAVLLQLVADHMSGTGAFTTVLVARCRDKQLDVVFEAEGEGLNDASFSSSQELTVTRLVWSPGDAHASPSREAEERYRWSGGNGRFVLVSKVERAGKK